MKLEPWLARRTTWSSSRLRGNTSVQSGWTRTSSCERSCRDGTGVPARTSAVEDRRRERSANAEEVATKSTMPLSAPRVTGRGVGCARYMSPPIASERMEHLTTGCRWSDANWITRSCTAWRAHRRASTVGVCRHVPSRASTSSRIGLEDQGKEWNEA
eukprot:scaffold260854_cov31-Tisochrysis_lutea.AAC.1